jgi:hypothetical protein
VTTTQQKILDGIERHVTRQGLDLVIDRDYANTGTLYATTRDGLDPVGARLRYNFQDTYWTIKDPDDDVGPSLAAVGAGFPDHAPVALAKVVGALVGDAGRPEVDGYAVGRTDAEALDEIAQVVRTYEADEPWARSKVGIAVIRELVEQTGRVLQDLR